MLWSATTELLIIQVFVLLFLGMIRFITPKPINAFLAQHWKILAPVVWSLTFIVVLNITNIISALIIATTTTLIGKLVTKLTLGTQPQRQPKRTSKPNVTFRSCESFYQR